MFEKFAGYREIRLMYLGISPLLKSIEQDFIVSGAKRVAPHSFAVSPSLLQRLGLAERSSFQVKVNFYSDAHKLVEDLPSFHACVIIVDERTVSGTQDKKPVCFAQFRTIVEKFTPQGFHYSMRKVVVVLPKSVFQGIQAGSRTELSSVKTVLIEPTSTIDLFVQATEQLYTFRKNHRKTALCISGGALDGYLYTLGVTEALELCLLNKKCNDFDIFCGVSSGSIVASCLAAGIDAQSLSLQAHRKHTRFEPLRLSTLFDFASGEMVTRFFKVFHALSSRNSEKIFSRLKNTVPIGFFKGDKLKNFFKRQLSLFGVEDKISALKKELYISVTDQDSGEHVTLGDEPWREVQISQAIRASTAMPVFYLPELINGHWFTDGQLTGTADFNTAIRKGASLVVYVDPIVPYTSHMPGAVTRKGGYFTAVQAIKTLLFTRSSSVLRHTMDRFPDVDFIVFQPTDEVMEAMAGNPMKYSIHTELIEAGKQCTLLQIFRSYDSMAHKFAKHGWALLKKEEILNYIK